jgi:regulator of protease activity HflC (stomatin/prohibitin superfamily)
MNQFLLLLMLSLGGAGVASSVRIINQGNAALVERVGSFRKRLDPGLSFLVPGLDRIVFQDTLRLKVLDIAPQSCITADNVSIPSMRLFTGRLLIWNGLITKSRLWNLRW